MRKKIRLDPENEIYFQIWDCQGSAEPGNVWCTYVKGIIIINKEVQ